MAMYTFHLFREGGAGTMLDALDLPDDGAGFARAGELLAEHMSCDRVEVWQGDRQVVARYRHQPIIRPMDAPAQVSQ